MAIIDVYGRALAYEMLVAAGRESDCCSSSSSIGSWSEPCRPNWWLRPSLEHFEGKEERNSSGGRQQKAAAAAAEYTAAQLFISQS